MKVVSNTAIALDGRINTREGRFIFLGSARDHARMSALRADADAVLVGGATFRNWPHAALPDDADLPRLRGRPWNVVVSRSLRLPAESDWALDGRVQPLLLTSSADSEMPATVEVAVPPGGAELSVAWMLEQLRARGVERLLVEAGGDLLFQFLAADAIDEMHVTLCPLVVGGRAASLVDGLGFDRASLRRLQLLSAEVEGDEVFLHYRNLRSATEPGA
ncbi:MAG: dihydrofolate reductase family protein [Pseudomonadota bacterium]|nr:dihydrofolate reductase family protein [Pseudomonadota bacterium]